MDHFSRSVDLSRGQSLQITVNVWDQIAHTVSVTFTSRGLEHRDLSALAVYSRPAPRFKFLGERDGCTQASLSVLKITTRQLSSTQQCVTI